MHLPYIDNSEPKSLSDDHMMKESFALCIYIHTFIFIKYIHIFIYLYMHNAKKLAFNESFVLCDMCKNEGHFDR